MSRTYTISDAAFPQLLAVPELRADVLFNQAVSAYGRHQSGKKHCCGGNRTPDAREHLVLAAAALRRYAARDRAGLSSALRREFGVPAESQLAVVLGGREPLML